MICVGGGAAKLRCVTTLVAGVVVFKELRCVAVRLEKFDSGCASCVIPLDFHIGVAGRISCLAETFDKVRPFVNTLAVVKLLVDEPTVKTKVFGDLIHFDGIGVFAISIFGKHGFYPAVTATDCARHKEESAKDFDTV